MPGLRSPTDGMTRRRPRWWTRACCGTVVGLFPRYEPGYAVVGVGGSAHLCKLFMQAGRYYPRTLRRGGRDGLDGPHNAADLPLPGLRLAVIQADCSTVVMDVPANVLGGAGHYRGIPDLSTIAKIVRWCADYLQQRQRRGDVVSRRRGNATYQVHGWCAQRTRSRACAQRLPHSHGRNRRPHWRAAPGCARGRGGNDGWWQYVTNVYIQTNEGTQMCCTAGAPITRMQPNVLRTTNSLFTFPHLAGTCGVIPCRTCCY